MPRNREDEFNLFNARLDDEEPQEMEGADAGQDYSIYENPSEVHDDSGIAPEALDEAQSLAELNGTDGMFSEMQLPQEEMQGPQRIDEMLAQETGESEDDIAALIRDELMRRRQERRLRSEDFQSKAMQMNAEIIKSLKR